MKLAIADPPYLGRAARWYGDGASSHGQLGRGAHAADRHPGAGEWDNPDRHRRLLEDLALRFDGWAIACPPAGVDAYRPLPASVRVMVWVKPNAMPSSSRLHNRWEAVLVQVPEGRRDSRGGVGQVSDVLIAPKLNQGFAGAKPPAWTRWVLDALSYDPETDTVDDLFPGSGAVGAEIAQGVLL